MGSGARGSGRGGWSEYAFMFSVALVRPTCHTPTAVLAIMILVPVLQLLSSGL